MANMANNPVFVNVETFHGGKGSHLSIRRVYNCTIRQDQILETWGENCTWGPYSRQVHSVIMGDTAPVMIWHEVYDPHGRGCWHTAQVAWLDKDGHLHQGCVYPDGGWYSESTSQLPGRFGLGFLRTTIREELPFFFTN